MAATTGASSVLGAGIRRRLSVGIAVAGALALAALGLLQLVKDGSFWIDEASVAQSLQALSPLDLFGRLERAQSFPRFLLLAVQGLVSVFGYTTAMARALPQLFFWLLCAAWMRLVFARFRDEPALVATAVLMLAIPATPFVYAAMLKSYTYDAFLALVPFLLGDRFFERVLVRGRGVGRAFALTAVVWLSYPFAMALWARLGGFWLARAVRGAPRLSARGAATFVIGTAAFGAALWWTDLRHTGEMSEVLEDFWGACVIGHEDTATLSVIDRLSVGFWDGRAEFSRGGGLPTAGLALLRMALAGGLASVALSLWRGFATGRGDDPEAHPEARAAWGSRSVGFAGLLLGLPLASWVSAYPICAGRLTLFALLPLLVIALEGLALAASGVRRLPRGSLASAVLGVALVAAVAPASLRDARALVEAPAPQDLRPLLAITREHPERPILTTGCSRRQLETLPEGLPAPLLVGDPGVYEVALSESREAWLLVVRSEFCSGQVRKVRRAAEHFEARYEEPSDVLLFEVRLADPRRPR